MSKKIVADGKTYVVPDDATDDEINEIVGPSPSASPRPAGLSPGVDLPGLPTTRPAANMQGIAPLGTVGDTVSNVLTHAKNAVTGPYHAFTDAPRTPQEQAVKGATADSSLPARALGQFGLGAYRSLVAPTVDNAKQAASLYKQGDKDGAVGAAASAIPIVGPWAQNIASDLQTKGMLPAAAGFATDLAIPFAAAKGAGLALKGAGAAARLASSTPESLKLAGTRAIVPGDAGSVLNRALKPGVQYGADTSQLFNDTMKPVVDVNPKMQGLGDYVDAVGSARQQQAGLYQDLISPYRDPGTGPYRPSAVDGNPIAVAQMDSIPAVKRLEQPADANGKGGIINKTAKIAGNYDRDFTVPELDDLRQGHNQDLHRFYAKAQGDQYAALADPETARVKAAADATRESLYGKLAQDTGKPVSEIEGMQQLYGKLADVESIAGKRETVYGRHDPVSLAEKIATSHGGPMSVVGNYAVQKAIKGLTDPDALVRSAVDRFQNPESSLQTGGGLFQRSLGYSGKLASAMGNSASRYARVAPLFSAPKK